MKNTEDELQFGDMIELDFTRDTENGVVHHYMECKFLPELIPILLEAEAIEEREVKEEKEEDNTAEESSVMEELFKANETLELRVEALESAVNALKGLLTKIVA